MTLVLCSSSLVAQIAEKSPDDQASAQQPSTQELKQNFDRSVIELKTAIKEIKRLGVLHFESESDVAYEYREQWEAEAKVSEAAYQKVVNAAFAYFHVAKNPSTDILQIVAMVNPKMIESGRLKICNDTTNKLLKIRPDEPSLITLKGKLAPLMNDFEAARAFKLNYGSEIENFTLFEKHLYEHLDELQEKYAVELKLQEEETSADNLPHAIVETNKGTFVIELFENQAPETVANFINLNQTGYYDGMIFHHVLKGVMAHTGKMTLNRAVRLGYTIYDESERPDARCHFRGSVSMYLNSEEKNAGGAEFQIMQIPGPKMDGRNTVFGRVISGMEIIDELQGTNTVNDKGKEEFIEGIVPDKIKSIVIKRLREDHDYEPNRVKK